MAKDISQVNSSHGFRGENQSVNFLRKNWSLQQNVMELLRDIDT